MTFLARNKLIIGNGDTMFFRNLTDIRTVIINDLVGEHKIEGIRLDIRLEGEEEWVSEIDFDFGPENEPHIEAIVQVQKANYDVGREAELKVIPKE